MKKFQSSPPNILSSAYLIIVSRSGWPMAIPWCSHFPFHFRKAHSRAALKSIGLRMSPCLTPRWTPKNSLHAPHHFEKSNPPSIKQRKAAEQVAPSMLGNTGCAQPGLPSNALTANSFKDNQGVVNTIASSKTNLIHWFFFFQYGWQNNHETFWQKFCMQFWLQLSVPNFWSVANPPFFGSIVNKVCRQNESSCPAHSIPLSMHTIGNWLLLETAAHIAKLPIHHWIQRVLHWQPVGPRRIGRPKHRCWEDTAQDFVVWKQQLNGFLDFCSQWACNVCIK